MNEGGLSGRCSERVWGVEVKSFCGGYADEVAVFLNLSIFLVYVFCSDFSSSSSKLQVQRPMSFVVNGRHGGAVIPALRR